MSALPPKTGVHVVLGGSKGIGFAYAIWLARRRAALLVSARGEIGLDAARRRLLAAGGNFVEVLPADMTDPSARAALLAQLEQFELNSVFAGGPSPPGGPVESLTPADLRAAFEICLAYPHEVLSWAINGVRKPQRIVLLSSSAASEPLAGHPFFASALFRRTLDHLVSQFQGILSSHGIQIDVWHPSVVLTELSEAFARTLPPAKGVDSYAERLRIHFNQDHIQTSEEYVDSMMGSINFFS